MPDSQDRRKRRSPDAITALHYQLAAVKKESSFDAVVLVDDAGRLMAGAGAWPVCEELAAYAPYIVNRRTGRGANGSETAARIANETHVRTMSLDGSQVMLCARGKTAHDVTRSMVRAAAGCRRILHAEI